MSKPQWLMFAFVALLFGGFLAWNPHHHTYDHADFLGNSPLLLDLYERSDLLIRQELHKLDSDQLMETAFQAASARKEDVHDPELAVRHALIAESQARFDAERGDNGWGRAEMHYVEAIRVYKKLDADRGLSFIKKRTEALEARYENACLRQGKAPDLEEALKNNFKFFDSGGP